MQRIVPHLWFDQEADEAAHFYISLFQDGRLINKIIISETPSGTAEIVIIEIGGQEFQLLSAGPYATFNPCISFLINCDTVEEVEMIWEKLIDRGEELMPLGDYPFSEKYGWAMDRFGVSWQVMYLEDRKDRAKIIPTMMYVGDQCGKAEDAMLFYTSIFENSKTCGILRYSEGAAPELPGTIQHEEFLLDHQLFAAMDSAIGNNFGFNDAISLVVNCDTQEEVDYYWDKLSAVPDAEQCGWLKDKYGMSWQIVPTIVYEMMQSKEPGRVANMSDRLLKMKKLMIAELQEAFDL